MAVSVVAKFVADEWFKIMAILSFLLLVAAITVDLKVDNPMIALASAAGLFLGLAEMAFRPYRVRLIPNPDGGVLKAYGRPRQLNVSGCLLMIAALLFAAAAAYRGWQLLSAF